MLDEVFILDSSGGIGGVMLEAVVALFSCLFCGLPFLTASTVEGGPLL